MEASNVGRRLRDALAWTGSLTAMWLFLKLTLKEMILKEYGVNTVLYFMKKQTVF